jgi:ATP-dependent DNA ligase
MSDRVRSDGYVSPCIPTLVAKPPTGPDWVHEIKHDGYRLIVRETVTSYAYSPVAP